MKLSHKLQKLFDFDVLVSVWEHASRWTHPVNTARIFRSLDDLDFESIRERAPYRPNPRRIRKFINLIQDLWLDRTPPLEILDLGCGAGYFLYICKLFGHNGIGLDMDERPLYRETLPLLNVHRVVYRIEAQVSLPDFRQRFDLVTASRVCFHIKRWPEISPLVEWTSEDWRFFINDVRSRVLKPHGRVFLQFNPRPDDSPFFTSELRRCFLSEGARIVRSKALFVADPTCFPRFKQTERPKSRMLALFP
jgi:SAM-dependent methyltransferase